MWIALPTEEDCKPENWHKWMHLSDKAFFAKYQVEVLEGYVIPSPHEVNVQLGKDDVDAMETD